MQQSQSALPDPLRGGNNKSATIENVVLRANIAGVGLSHIEWREDKLTDVESIGPIRDGEPYCSPGLVDLQINGIAGVDFGASDLRAQDVIRVLEPIWSTGVTTFCPTIITNTHENLCRSFCVLEEARRRSEDFASSAPCYHLEGPYLSAGESHGAHNPAWMRDPCDDEFAALQEAAGGRIGIVTIAPERHGALRFIRKWKETGVVFAIGHTDCETAQIAEAVKAGASLSTHLGNGCPERIHRHRSPIWPQLASEGLRASLICDGFHLTPEFTRVAYRMKGRQGTILITDSIHVNGMAPGVHSLAGMPVQLHESGRVDSLANPGALAGSTLRLDRAVAQLAKDAEIPLHEALEAASRNPARVLAPRYAVCTAIEPGQPANLVVYWPGRHRLEILETYVRGVPVRP